MYRNDTLKIIVFEQNLRKTERAVVTVSVCVSRSRPRYSCIHLSNNGDVLQYRLCECFSPLCFI